MSSEYDNMSPCEEMPVLWEIIIKRVDPVKWGCCKDEGKLCCEATAEIALGARYGHHDVKEEEKYQRKAKLTILFFVSELRIAGKL